MELADLSARFSIPCYMLWSAVVLCRVHAVRHAIRVWHQMSPQQARGSHNCGHVTFDTFTWSILPGLEELSDIRLWQQWRDGGLE